MAFRIRRETALQLPIGRRDRKGGWGPRGKICDNKISKRSVRNTCGKASPGTCNLSPILSHLTFDGQFKVTCSPSVVRVSHQESLGGDYLRPQLYISGEIHGDERVVRKIMMMMSSFLVITLVRRNRAPLPHCTLPSYWSGPRPVRSIQTSRRALISIYMILNQSRGFGWQCLQLGETHLLLL